MGMFDGYKNKDKKRIREMKAEFAEKIQTHFHDKQVKACDEYHKYLCQEYDNPLTLKGHFSKARKILDNRFNSNSSVEQDKLNKYKQLFVLPDEVMKSIKKKYIQKVVNKNRLQTIVTKQEFLDNIEKCKTIIEKETKDHLALIIEKETKDHLALIIAIAVVTGRRFFEVTCKAKFTITNDENTLLFTGQAKTRKNETHEAFKIPCLISNILIINALTRLRELKPETINYESEEFNNKYSRAINRKMEKLKLNGITQPKDVRNLYLAYCLKYIKVIGISNNAYASEILGHSNDDIQTANSYMTHVIIDD